LYKQTDRQLHLLLDARQQHLLKNGLRGIEKESLRITPDGFIAQTPHPSAFGSALTHPYITTDYSEALLELITPPFHDAVQTLQFLEDLHVFVYQHLGDERLLATSIPCRIDGDESIPIARYGTSNIGRMKHVYRRGLAYRYGRSMQAIAGVHFNYSVAEGLWPVLKELNQRPEPLETLIADRYFGLIRNILRYGWLLLYLFGASPAVCKSFLAHRRELSGGFLEFDKRTLYRPYATSLRMSDIGYKNDCQANLNISFNNLDEYIAGLTRAIETPYPPYQEIGVKVDGEYRQLNANILQIENEYYSSIRPKQVAFSGEKPTLALRRRGIRYIELRSLDLNCFDPAGIDLEQLRFLELFVLFCLLEASPHISGAEQKELNHNFITVACCGRTPGLTLRRDGRDVPLTEWATGLCEAMQGLAEILDSGTGENVYLRDLADRMAAIRDPELTPSARIMSEMREAGASFAPYALKMSERHADYFRARRLSRERIARFETETVDSLAEQRRIEASDTLSFDEFLARYFAQR
jgi:glutamate--cysteine ligase